MSITDKWDDGQLQPSDAERLKGKIIASAAYGRVEGFEYEALTLEFADGSQLILAPWDYEGFSAGMYKRWTRND